MGHWALKSANKQISDTIYALSTAPGRSAIAVVRISGPACLDIYRQLCPDRPLPKPRTAILRSLYDPQDLRSLSSRVLDHSALVLYFPAPKTVTGEDVLELHVHGGPAIIRAILNTIPRCGGGLENNGSLIRPAEPGEFTKWAFYNGRLDLTQAEALGETLTAETEQQRRLAINGSDGGLAKRYEEWRLMLLYARGELEALIDFSEDQHFDESPVEFMASVSAQVKALKTQVELHLRNASKGELLRNGVSIALLGAPNAGKSSLLNRIVGREAAIVSAEEGTTRDIVDVTIDLQGWLCRLGDMAGLRGAGNGLDDKGTIGLVEQEGIRRARERALQADVIMALLSIERKAGRSIDVPINAQVLEAIEECLAMGKTVFVVLNKTDLIEDESHQEVTKVLSQQIQDTFPMVPAERICAVSCLEDDVSSAHPRSGSIQSLLARLTRAFVELTTATTGQEVGSMTPAESQSYWTASLSVTHRQSTYLEQCLHHLTNFIDQSLPPTDSINHGENGVPADPNANLQVEIDIVTAAEHLRFAADCLARITGRGESGDVEDVLGVVFEK